ncbi:Holliday junction DNA helicase subunit RuvB [Anaerobranca californiensis DSM 14826]|uniref:Holliday junction branch migration complex subunit RuvB n=1 Tax=Anaerobranca californiensis DSM 14826 TaxID=1120989 RepID=A0A1M6LPM0_9FIRM|nr:Holliday junction branch migration DNA helicase RuvB [Anaerobranca californiensis]SHJ73111.1 Holliday junction DNA helicase subunit RuvB [Anaerobranca californiensis DSM 14826]
MEGRIVSAKIQREDIDNNTEISLRPKGLAEYIGQNKVKENLRIFIQAAKARKEALDHVLLYGPPGLGKTTLANIIANEMGAGFKVTSGPTIERAGDLAAILSSLQPYDILFIDEIHRLNRAVEEVLYPAMEDFALDIMLGKGPGAQSVRIEIPPFTLVGATTRAGALSSPLRDRFGVLSKLEFYDEGQLKEIVLRASRILGVEITDDGAGEIARRSRGTPRIANRILKRVRDFAQVKGEGVIDIKMAKEGLNLLEIDDLGLDKTDRIIIDTIIECFDGGPVGVESLAATISEEVSTIEDVYEPYLLQMGLISRTPRGRIVTAKGYGHLGKLYKYKAEGGANE